MKVVVVGGGFGGVKTALELGNKPGFEVTLITPGTNFEYHGALYRSGTGRSPLEVVIPLRQIFADTANVDVVLDQISGIQPDKRRIISETGGIYQYDELVLALGNTVNYFGIEGMEEYSRSMITVSQTIALRHELVRLLRGRKHRLNIVVIGAGPTGVELAAELPRFASMVETKYGTEPHDLNITLIEAANRVLPGLLPSASEKVEQRLRTLGVQVRTSTSVNACRPGTICLDEEDLEADLIVWTAGSQVVDFYADHPKLFKLERGRVKVDAYLRAEGHERIYVIGDNAATKYSGMAQTALYDAGYVARNFLRRHQGAAMVPYRARQPIYVVPVGPRWAVLQTARGVTAGYRGWLVRRRADLAIYRNFQPYKLALKTWRKGNRLADF